MCGHSIVRSCTRNGTSRSVSCAPTDCAIRCPSPEAQERKANSDPAGASAPSRPAAEKSPLASTTRRANTSPRAPETPITSLPSAPSTSSRSALQSVSTATPSLAARSDSACTRARASGEMTCIRQVSLGSSGCRPVNSTPMPISRSIASAPCRTASSSLRIDSGAIPPGGDPRAQVLHVSLMVVSDAAFALQAGACGGDRSDGKGRLSARLRQLLDDRDPRSALGRGDRSTETGIASADDRDVDGQRSFG